MLAARGIYLWEVVINLQGYAQVYKVGAGEKQKQSGHQSQRDMTARSSSAQAHVSRPTRMSPDPDPT
jgi:hypothetical protein